MKAVPAKSQFEMGLGSMVNMLSQISAGTVDGNNLITNLRQDLSISNELSTSAIGVQDKLISSLRYYSKKGDKTQQNILKVLQNGYARIDEFFSSLINKQAEKSINGNLPALFVPQQENQFQIATLDKTNKILDNILKNSKGKEEKSSKSFGLVNVAKVENIASQGKEKVKEVKEKFDLAKMASSIVEIKKNLTTKMIKNFDKFGDAVKRLWDMDDSKADKFGSNIEKTTKVLETANTKLSPVTKTIALLSGSLILLSLAVIAPTFTLATTILAGFITLISKTSSNKEMTKGLPEFAKGILLLSGSLLLLGFVNSSSIFKLLGFIVLLGIVLKGFSGGKNLSFGQPMPSLTGFAAGIGLLTLAMIAMNYVAWESVGKMITFILGLGLSFALFNKLSGGTGIRAGMSGLPGFAMGLGLMTLALFAFAEIPFMSILKMIGFIALLGITLAMVNKIGSGPAVMRGLPGFAFGLGLMVLSILAFAEIPWSSIFKMLTFIGLLGVELAVINKLGGGGAMRGLPGFAFGLGLMVLAMYAMNELPIVAMFKTLAFIAGLGLVMLLFKAGGGKNMLMIAGGLIAISLALWVFKKTNFTWQDGLVLGGTILGIGLAMVALGAVGALLLTGVVATVGMAVGITLIALALAAVTNLPIVYDNILPFALSVLLLAGTFALVTPLALVGCVGAVLFLPIAISSVLAALALSVIDKLKFDNIGNFALSVLKLAGTFALITPLAILGVIGAALFIPIATGALLGALALAAISALPLNNKALDNFGIGMHGIISVYGDLGFVELGKGAAKSLLLLPILTSSLLAAGTLKLISSLDIAPDKISGFSVMLNSFVTSTLDSLAANSKKMADAKPGIDALAKLMSIGKSLADTISLMANMQFYEYEVRNGKLVLKNARRLTPADMAMVGQNLAAMLNCLIEPLVLLGSDSDEFVIGGVKVANPFKNDKATKGMDMLSKLGTAFMPLVTAVKTFTSLPIATDPKALDMFSRSMVITIKTIQYVMGKLEVMKFDNANRAIQSIQAFTKSFQSVESEKFTTMSSVMNKMVDTLSDDVKWKKISTNLDKIKIQFRDIAKNINSIDINKAIAFEKNLNLLLSNKTNDKLVVVAENLKEVVNLLKGSDDEGTTKTGNSVEKSNENKTTPSVPIINKSLKGDGLVRELLTTVITTLIEIDKKIAGTNSKLNSSIKVVPVGGNNNSFPGF